MSIEARGQVADEQGSLTFEEALVQVGEVINPNLSQEQQLAFAQAFKNVSSTAISEGRPMTEEERLQVRQEANSILGPKGAPTI